MQKWVILHYFLFECEREWKRGKRVREGKMEWLWRWVEKLKWRE
jgi:hypothetical protein